MEKTEEWKKAYYESDSRKRLWIIAVVVIVLVGSIVYFLLIEKAEPVELGIDITPEDVTYSAEGIESEEMLELYDEISNQSMLMSNYIRSFAGYNWTILVTNPSDGKKCKVAALSHLLIVNSITGFEAVYLSNRMNLSDYGFLSLPIEMINVNDTSKQNIFLMISYLKQLQEFYKEKEIPFAETDINRLNFLSAYFGVVDIVADEIIDVSFLIPEFILSGKELTYGAVIKQLLECYDDTYYSIMQRIEIVEAYESNDHVMVSLRNTGRVEIGAKHLMIFARSEATGIRTYTYPKSIALGDTVNDLDTGILCSSGEEVEIIAYIAGPNDDIVNITCS